jgi:hypothetical protein
VQPVLADLVKTSGDLRLMSARALEQLPDALLPRLRGPLDEVRARTGLRDKPRLEAQGWASMARRAALPAGC